MAVNDKIRTVDYNDVQTKLSNLIGVGSGTTGWGQTVNSSPVTVSNRITVNEWANLRNDIINGFRHINSGTPSTVQATANNIIKYNDSGTTPAQATEVVVQYDRWADQLIADRFTIHPTQAVTKNKGSQTRTTSWNTGVSTTVTVTFTTATQARYFFNSGGKIRINSTRTSGTNSSQNNSWTNILNSAGTREFGAQVPTTGFSPMNGRNFYRLTSSFQQWYLISGSSPYTLNSYSISARSNVADNSTGTANQIEFLIQWTDSYTDPGPPSLGDLVDGTLTLAVTTLEASGILVPAAAGLFQVESPSVSIGPILGS
jgi:hypothetical protein